MSSREEQYNRYKNKILNSVIYHTKTSEAFSVVQEALEAFPGDGDFLSLGSFVALLENKPSFALQYQKQLRKNYQVRIEDVLFEAIAWAKKGNSLKAKKILKPHGITTIKKVLDSTRFKEVQGHRFLEWGNLIFPNQAKKQDRQKKEKASKQTRVLEKPEPKVESATKSDKLAEFVENLQKKYELPPIQSTLPFKLKLSLDDSIMPAGMDSSSPDEQKWYRLRSEYCHLNLLKGYDELLCLNHLHNVETFWYQVETVRKVLRQFRGRVLLSDEVGLGKTIEAGMVLKEYLLRGMVKKILILTPASLVGQWQEEMESKFDIDFETSYSSLIRTDPKTFWKQEKIIASIASARREEHFDHLKSQKYDLVIVDEAHHLKNRNTKNWKLVDILNKRFLLLLSATPLQNSLIELYNLLTLLKPGIFNTEKEFRGQYMIPRKPRIPANRDHMRDLMRDVMIRNTRSIVDVRLPARHALTSRLTGGGAEQICYQELNQLIQKNYSESSPKQRMSFHHMLTAAGSSPTAAAAAIHRFAEKHAKTGGWKKLAEKYEALPSSIKSQTLIELLKKNPHEKKMVFVHHLASLVHLDKLLKEHNITFARFDGSMSGQDKDRAIEQFREHTSVLLCTESGGEGRNMQFCNTLINYDLPWNPMKIEQRIGRIHRIGQEREVFIFNLVVEGTLEGQILRILDEKINMFELVVGEIGVILGEMEEKEDFADMVFNAWIAAKEQERDTHFDELGERISQAKEQYEAAKQLDDELFGEEFETA